METDKAMNLEKPEYLDYLKKLSEVSGIEVKELQDSDRGACKTYGLFPGERLLCIRSVLLSM